MTRTGPAVALLLLIAAGWPVRGDARVTPPATGPVEPAGTSPLEDLVAHYRRRCEAEIRDLAGQIDRIEEALATPPAGATGPLLERADRIWEQRGPAGSAWLGLVEATRKYSRWARDARLPPGFEAPPSLVDDALGGKRWETLRPVLIPIDRSSPDPSNRLGWNRPDGDSARGQELDARIVDWLLLLRWLAEPAEEQAKFHRDWVLSQVGADLVRGWRRRPARSLPFLHGDYLYQALPSPAGLESVAWRARVVVAHLCREIPPPHAVPELAPGTDRIVDLARHVRDKDRLLAALLEHVVRHRATEPVSLDWLLCGARTHPYLTVFQPELAGGVLQALAPRTDPRFPAGLLDDLDAVSPGAAAEIRSALFRYQARSIDPGGVWTAPSSGWSTWTPRNGPGSGPTGPRRPEPGGAGPADPGRDPDQHGTDVTEPGAAAPTGPDRRESEPGSGDSTVAAAGAWRSICQWVAGELRRAGVERPAGAGVPDVEYRRDGWCLAFGAEELADVLAGSTGSPVPGTPDRPARRRPAAGRPAVRLEAIRPHRSVTVSVRDGSQEIARRTFRIPGPWPSWFAARYGPAADRQLLFPLLCLMVFIWRFGRILDRSRDVWDRFGVAWTTITVAAVWLLTTIPRPRMVGELGGTVEIVVPVDGAVPGAIRELVPLVGAHIYRRLCREGGEGPTAIGLEDESWLAPYRTLFGTITTPIPLLPRREDHHLHPLRTLSELDFRILGYAWGRSIAIDGPVEPTALPRFRRSLAALEYRGEKDRPPQVGAAETTPASLAVLVGDGDHGSLTAAADPAAVPGFPIVTLFPVGPSRDADPSRRLDTASRLRWLAGGSTAAWCLLPDGRLLDPAAVLADGDTLRAADAPGRAPQDMDAARERWWQALGAGERAAVAHRFAGRAIEKFQAGRSRTSRTVLAVTWDRWRLVGFLVAAILFVACPTWLCKMGWTRSRDVVALLASAGAVAGGAFAIFPLLGLQGLTRAYGLDAGEALRCGAWWSLIGLAAGATLSVTFIMIARRSPYTRVIVDPLRTWPVGRTRLQRTATVQGVGTLCVGVGVGWLLASPVQHVGVRTALVPHDLWASTLWGLGLWMLGASLLWTLPPPPPPPPPPSLAGASRPASPKRPKMP